MRAGGGWCLVLAGLGAAAGGTACEQHEPPTPEGSPSIAVPEMAVSRAPASGAATATPTATPSAAATAAATPGDPALLPQTRDLPHPSGPSFDGRVAALWDAIVRDAPDAGTPAFFPLGAYQQVKDVADPSADWKQRLLAAYRHDIHLLHGRLGDGAGRAMLVGLDVPQARERWVEPGEEWNKIGYFRVFNSKLRYLVDGEPRAFDVKSLISWRGEWYVVHLSAIK